MLMRPIHLAIFFRWISIAILSLAACSERKGAKNPAGKEDHVYRDSFVVALLPERNVFKRKRRCQPEAFTLETIGRETNPEVGSTKAKQ